MYGNNKNITMREVGISKDQYNKLIFIRDGF